MNGRKLLWMCCVWPEPDSSAAGTRTKQLLLAAVKRGFNVTAVSGAESSPYRSALENCGVATACFPPNDSAFDHFIRELAPDCVIFDRFMLEEQFGWRVRHAAPDALRVLDTVDLHSLRRARHREFSAVTDGAGAMWVPADTFTAEDGLRELAAIHRSDLALCVSTAEIELLRGLGGVGSEKIRRVSLLYPATEDIRGYDDRADFVAIGGLNHAPNADSFDVLASVVWPKIRAALVMRGQATSPSLHLWGSYPTQSFRALANPALGIAVHGRAEAALPLLSRYRVNLAPLRFGAGVKGKVADGWAVGTPCVGTEIAAEGMTEQGVFGGEVAKDWDAFARAAADLYADQERWNLASLQGIRLVNALFNHELESEKLFQSIDISASQLSEMRARNVIGAILWREQFRSAEYMSRWIEAKNKLAPATV
jgi:hypothetical protein